MAGASAWRVAPAAKSQDLDSFGSSNHRLMRPANSPGMHGLGKELRSAVKTIEKLPRTFAVGFQIDTGL